MDELFLKLVNLSVTASWMVLAVLALRLVLKRAPRWVFCILWALVAVRLICPFSLESALSLIPSGRPIPAEFLYTAEPQINSGLTVIDRTVNPVLMTAMAPAPGDSVNPAQVWTGVLARVWLAGMAVMLLCALFSWAALRRRVRTATRLAGNIKQSEYVDSPFVLGLFCPTIYLPYRLESDDLPHVIAHEQAHIRRRDHWWKPIGYLLLSIYWFNPLMWAAYIFLCRDIESACDERVIRAMEPEDRRAYSTALLNCSVRRVRIAACPLAFGETGVKERIKSVMNYKKPTFWIILAALAACAAAAVCLLTNPAHPTNTIQWFDYMTSGEGFSVDDNGVKGTYNDDGTFTPDPDYPEITLDVYPGVTFRCIGPHVEVISESGTVSVGRDFICKAYFSDLSGDGKPELYMRTIGGTMEKSALIAYNPATGATAELPWTNEFVYDLTLNDSRLWVTKRYSKGDSTDLEAGVLMWKNGALAIDHNVPGGVYLRSEEYPPISFLQAIGYVYRRDTPRISPRCVTLTLQKADGSLGSTYQTEAIGEDMNIPELWDVPYSSYTWIPLDSVPAYSTDYAVIASGVDGRTLTFRPNDGAGIAEYRYGDTVQYWAAEVREENEGHTSAAEDYLAQYYAMDAAYTNIVFRQDGSAEDAANTFAGEVYSTFMTSRASGNPNRFVSCEPLEWTINEVSPDGSAVSGRFRLKIRTPALAKCVLPQFGYVCKGSDLTVSMFTGEASFLIKRMDDGLWHCVEIAPCLLHTTL